MYLSQGYTTYYGKSYRQSTRLLQKIKENLNKPSDNFVSIKEFCSYTGLNYDEVIPTIK